MSIRTRKAKEAGARLVIVNRGDTDLDDLCDLRFREIKAGPLLTKLLETVETILNKNAAAPSQPSG